MAVLVFLMIWLTVGFVIGWHLAKSRLLTSERVLKYAIEDEHRRMAESFSKLFDSPETSSATKNQTIDEVKAIAYAKIEEYANMVNDAEERSTYWENKYFELRKQQNDGR